MEVLKCSVCPSREANWAVKQVLSEAVSEPAKKSTLLLTEIPDLGESMVH